MLRRIVFYIAIGAAVAALANHFWPGIPADATAGDIWLMMGIF